MNCLQDQLDYLRDMKIDAKTINSKITAAERQEVLFDLKSVNPATRLLYVTPEQAKTDTFKVQIIFCFVSKEISNLIFIGSSSEIVQKR
jgi:superfamily II DNA helicase RecQ